MPNTEPKPSPNFKIVHVAVGVIERFSSNVNTTASTHSNREILISKRAEHVHQGGLWEFPGGKVEDGELVKEALSRELYEELGIQVSVQCMSPLIQIEHDYGDKHVLLDVYTVQSFEGEAIGKEGQVIQWVNEKNLQNFTFPDANQAILSACKLPSSYFITPDYETLEQAIVAIKAQLEQGVVLFLFRQPKLSVTDYSTWVKSILNKLPAANGKIMLSRHLELLTDESINSRAIAGVQLPYFCAAELSLRPIDATQWLSVSCHNLEEIKHAQKINADFITLSPVLMTATHPEETPLTWSEFINLVRHVNIPVYALGGLTFDDKQVAIEAGAQGIAGIRMFLSE